MRYARRYEIPRWRRAGRCGAGPPGENPAGPGSSLSPARDDCGAVAVNGRAVRPAGPGAGIGPAGDRPTLPDAPGQLRTYKLRPRDRGVVSTADQPATVGVPDAVALSRVHPLIRAVARRHKQGEAAVTIECQARDAAAAVEAALAKIRRIAGLIGQIGIHDIKVTRGHTCQSAVPGWSARIPFPRTPRIQSLPMVEDHPTRSPAGTRRLQRQKLIAGEPDARLAAEADNRSQGDDA